MIEEKDTYTKEDVKRIFANLIERILVMTRRHTVVGTELTISQ